MSFLDSFKMSVHAVIVDKDNRVLQLKANYGDKGWGLPGGALEAGETVHEALKRECQEELGLDVQIKELTGVYYHKFYNSQVILFRCEIPKNSLIKLSEEHTEYMYFKSSDLTSIQQTRVEDCLNFNGIAVSRSF